MKIKISEPERPTDLMEPLLAMIQAAFADQHGDVDPETSANKYNEETLKKVIEDEHLAIASIGRQMVGSVLFNAEGDDLFLHTLAVSPDHRRKGVARALINHVVNCGEEGGYRQVTLNARKNMTGNRRLFESLGFREIEPDDQRRYYKQPTYSRMSKELIELNMR